MLRDDDPHGDVEHDPGAAEDRQHDEQHPHQGRVDVEALGQAGLTAPVLADDAQGSAASAYGLSAFPFFTAVSADGKVVARDSGELTPAQLDQLAANLAAAGS